MTEHESRSIPLPRYGALFAPERRIHAIDGRRLPWPGGIPVAVVAYLLPAVAGMLLLSRLPVLGPALGVVPPLIRLVLVPLGLSVIAWHARPDGRAIPAVAVTLAGHLVRRAAARPREVLANRPARVPLWPDLTGPPVSGRLRGPGLITLSEFAAVERSRLRERARREQRTRRLGPGEEHSIGPAR